ncbi:unnamed protein product [Adineta ricciae]|uniref:Spermatogenesis-associated protein 1 C-terminal domain-containing protein n=1 Tax=Adineta ricciae TaxID=249248 RepID=A0A813WPQ2_ADIRI|nr:unnamed protein product [Adineta ricciae]
MEPQMESEPSSLRNNLITVDRPDTAQLVDLHVYVIPTSVWQEQKNLAENDAIEQAISAGFVHVPQNLTIYDLRQHITDICGQEDGFPKDFIYLRSVGRCLAKVRPQQELELKVKNYRPPITFAPEIYVLEGHHDDDSSLASKSKSSLSHESSIQSSSSSTATTGRQESWTRSISESPAPIATLNPSFIHSSSEQQNSTILDRSATSSTSTLSRASSTLSARDLAKLREEQERLRLRQIELARQRREIEEEQQRRKTTESTQSDDSKTETRRFELPTRDIEAEKLKAAKEQEEQQRRRRELEVEAQKAALQREEQKRKVEQEKRQREIEQEEKNKNEQRNTLSKLEREKQEEEAATRIQASFRGYQSRQKSKDQKRHKTSNFAKSRGLWSADSDRKREQSPIKHKTIHSLPLERNEAQELERLQKEARELARRKAEEDHAEEIKAHEVVKLSEHLEKLKSERIELENNREAIIRRMQQLHAQIAVRRTEERDLWKQKYLVQKKKTAELEEKTRAAFQDQPDLASRTEQTKLRLNNSTKLRQQAENECQLLKQELHQMRSSLHSLEKSSIPAKLLPPPPLPQQQQQQNIPIIFDITLKY